MARRRRGRRRSRKSSYKKLLNALRRKIGRRM